MKQPKASQSGKKALVQLRLAVARATVRYALNTRGEQGDIPDGAELCELCDEYALRALAIWLATTCGSHICRSAMPKSISKSFSALLSGMVRTNEYPFANLISKELEEEIACISQDHLFSGLAPNVELLGTLFEMIANQSLDISLENGGKVGFDIQAKERRRIVGQFYTPPQVVKYCFDIAFSRNSPDLMKGLKTAKSEVISADPSTNISSTFKSFKVLDPSCGTGNFLSGFVRYIRHMNSAEKIPAEKSARQIYAIACDSLYGRELDPRAASLTRLCIALSVAEEIGLLCSAQPAEKTDCDHLYECLLQKLKKNIGVADSILAAADLPTGQNNDFDLVITNPPYVSFGARNQKVLLDTSARLLKKKYPQAAEYKVRYHSIFQDIAIRYAATGGSIVLLVPDGFLTGSYYRRLRGLLLANCRIQSLSELPASIIPEAVVGRWCVAHYIKEKTDDYSVQLQTFINERGQALDSVNQLKEGKTYSLPIGELRDKENDSFRLVFDKCDHALLELSDRLPRLKSVLSGYTGIRSLSGKNSITGRQPLTKSWRRGITSGAQVRRFMVNWMGDWIDVNPDLLFKGGFNESIVESPKILVRQTGDSLICAYDQSGLYHLNNVHSFSAALSADPSLDLLSLCALMNSTLWRHIYRLRTRETGRALAQVDIDTVESMPFQPLKKDAAQSFSVLTQWIAELIAYNARASCQKTDDLILFIDRSIDRLVYDLYELDPQIVSRVETVSWRTRSKKNQPTMSPAELTYIRTESPLAERLIRVYTRLDSGNPAAAYETFERLPSSKEVNEFIEEIS